MERGGRELRHQTRSAHRRRRRYRGRAHGQASRAAIDAATLIAQLAAQIDGAATRVLKPVSAEDETDARDVVTRPTSFQRLVHDPFGGMVHILRHERQLDGRFTRDSVPHPVTRDQHAGAVWAWHHLDVRYGAQPRPAVAVADRARAAHATWEAAQRTGRLPADRDVPDLTTQREDAMTFIDAFGETVLGGEGDHGVLARIGLGLRGHEDGGHVAHMPRRQLAARLVEQAHGHHCAGRVLLVCDQHSVQPGESALQGLRERDAVPVAMALLAKHLAHVV